jgi:GNAT superfamily N-acetyltransferase
MPLCADHSFSDQKMSSSVTLISRTGAAIDRYIPDIARLRITVFREFPYLYDGDKTYEERYLQRYRDTPGALVVLALHNDRVIGASTGQPLATETDAFRRPFTEQGYAADSVFYYGESVLDRAWRGQGLGSRFMEIREAHARSLGGIKHCAFCAVERPENHPRRPVDYQPLDDFWKRRGFVKKPTLRTLFSWKDLDETQESPKPMVFWVKTLSG